MNRYPRLLTLAVCWALAAAGAACGSGAPQGVGVATRLFDAGHPAQAEKIALRLANDGPKSMTQRIRLAGLLIRLRHADRAVSLLQSRELPPAGSDVLADAYLQSGHRDRAAATVRMQIAAKTDTAKTHRLYGEILLGRHETARAAEELETSLEKDGSDPMTAVYLAQAYLAEGKDDEAERLLRTTQGRFPNSPDVSIALADLLLRRRPKDRNAETEAVGLLERAVRRRPWDYGSRTSLGAILRRLGQYQKAEKVLSSLVKDRPRNSAGWNELGRTRLEAGNVDGAVEAFEKAAKAAPRRVDLWLNAGSACLEKADRDRLPGAGVKMAMAAFAKARELAPKDPRPYVGLARAWVKGDPGSNVNARNAMHLYRKALSFDPGDFAANLNLALLYYDIWIKSKTSHGVGYRKALEHFEKAEARRPRSTWPKGARNAYVDLLHR